MNRVAFCILFVAACHDDHVAPASAPVAPHGGAPSPSASAAPSSLPVAAPTSAPSAPSLPRGPEPKAQWIEPGGKSVGFTPGTCTRVVVSAAKGSVTVEGGKREPRRVKLGEGDAWSISRSSDPITITGTGLAALVEVPSECSCEKPPAPPTPERKPGESELEYASRIAQLALLAGNFNIGERHAMPRTGAPKLTWDNGAMRAELTTHDQNFETCEMAAVSSDGKPHNFNSAAYLGRLEGTSGVLEHEHATSWEVLFAIEAEGTMTLDGAPRTVRARDIVKVPPGAKHSWTPAPGTRLVAVQSYVPPGPEERFKALSP